MQPIRIYPEYALILTYDVLPGAQERYFRFVTSTFLPALQRRKLYMQNAWIVIGEGPERQIEFITEELANIRALYEDPEWAELEGELQTYVENYQKRIIRYRSNFKI